MQLNNLKSAWQQFRVMNAMHPVASSEILAIIEKDTPHSKLQRLLLNVMVFAILTLICQGG